LSTDVSEHKEAEKELETLNAELERRVQQRTAQVAGERRRLFDVLEGLPVMICLLTPDHHVAFANRAFREKFGESEGRHCYDFCFGNKEPCSFCESYTVMETGRPHHWEVKGQDGSVIDAYDFPFTDVDGSQLILEMDVDITGRKRNEEELKKYREHLEMLVTERTKELREIEERFRTVIENSLDGISMLDLKTGRYVFMSPAQVKLTGFSMEEINNISVEEALERTHPDDREITISHQRRVATGDDVIEPVEYRWKVKSGDYRWFSDRRKLVRDGQGHPAALVGISRDITERKKLEQALVSLSKFPSENPSPVFRIDMEGLVLYANPASQELPEPFNLRVGQCVPATWRLHTDKSLSTNTSLDFEETIGDRAFLFKLTPIPSEGYVNIYGTDVTERRKAENDRKNLLDTVQREKDRLSALVNSIADEVWFADTGKKFTLANPSAVHEFTKKDGTLEMDVERLAASLEVLRPDGSHRPVEEAPPLRALKGEVIRNQEEIVRTPARDELRHRQISASPVKDGKGNIIGSVSVVRDITEEKKAEEKLKEMERFAAIGRTAAMVGHDLRNPLQAIVGIVGLAEEHLQTMNCAYEEKQENVKLLKEITDQIYYMDKIVSDLQDYAAPVKPKLSRTDLHELISEALSTSRVPENITVSAQIPKGLRKVMVDPTIMRRVLSNLVTNSIQAMAEGGKLSIKVSRKQKPKTLVVSVEDTGVGIRKANYSRLFTPLFTTKAKGQGLGLPVCKRLVEALGGTIAFRSRVGKGSKFTVRLPLEKK
jgi:PAS domain S-box-containing protein